MSKILSPEFGPSNEAFRAFPLADSAYSESKPFFAHSALFLNNVSLFFNAI